MSKLIGFLRREPVFLISALAAAVSCCFIPPDAAYLDYPDFRTLALLYALMTVVAGLRAAGVFTALADLLCRRANSVRALGAVLIGLCFFSSMLITNDVALLTFVPFTVVVLGLAGQGRALTRTVVLETVAANLGSMLTPVGNPQNLYLYSFYQIPFAEFLSVTFPIWIASLILLLACCFLLPRARLEAVRGGSAPIDRRALALYLALFAVCLLTVLRLVSWPLMLGAVVAVLLIFDRRTLLRADFMLLLTFVCFFIFAGNLARIDAVNALLRSLLTGREYAVSLLASQVISNVPAALLLSGFTGNAYALLLGVNVGGLGTPIASLASLIGLKLYSRAENARTGRFLLEFTTFHLAFLLILSALRWILTAF